MLTQREKIAIVDVVAEALIAQGGGSFDLMHEDDMLVDDAERVTCLYRNGAGKACGIGQLISDEVYNSCHFETLPADDFAVQEALRRSGMPEDREFYGVLQKRLHDNILIDHSCRRNLHRGLACCGLRSSPRSEHPHRTRRPMNIEQKLAFLGRVEAHLVKQGKRSGEWKPGRGANGKPYFACLYRDPSGRNCAIGPYIADDHYNQQLEGNGAETPSVIKALLDSKQIEGLRSSDQYFLSRVQDAHDAAGHRHGEPEWSTEQFVDYVKTRVDWLRADVRNEAFDEKDDAAQATA